MSDVTPQAGTINTLDEAGVARLASLLKMKNLTATLSSSGWTGTTVGTTITGPYTQTLSVPTLKANDVAFVSIGQMTAEARDVLLKSKVTPIAQAANSITFEAEKEPTVNIPIVVTVQGEYNHTPAQNP